MNSLCPSHLNRHAFPTMADSAPTVPDTPCTESGRHILKSTASEQDLDQKKHDQLCNLCAELASSLASTAGVPTRQHVRSQTVQTPDNDITRRRVDADLCYGYESSAGCIEVDEGDAKPELKEGIEEGAEVGPEGGIDDECSDNEEDNLSTDSVESLENPGDAEETARWSPKPSIVVLSGGRQKETSSSTILNVGHNSLNPWPKDVGYVR